MQRVFVFGVVATVAVAVASVVWLDHIRLVAPTALFWIVVVAATQCVITSLMLARLALRSNQAELGIVASFFFAASVLPLVHGITVPGVLYGDNGVTTTSVFLAVPVGAAAAAAVAVSIRSARSHTAWRTTMMGTFAATSVLGAVLLAQPQISLHPTSGSTTAILASLASFAITTLLAARHVRLAVIAEHWSPLVVSAGYVLVGGTALMFIGASAWSTYFWLAHAIDIVGVSLATIGAFVVYRRRGGVFAVMAPITALDSRRAFESGLAPVVHRFVADLESKDRITRDHVVRTGALAIEVAEELRLDARTVRHCGLVGLLHDVGKLEIPDEILTKPGSLTDEEFAVMREHARLGAELVAASPVLADLAPAIRAHHERLDGRGYPDALAGGEIPPVARVIAACDAYDAMSHTRHYRAGMDADRVRSILLENAGTQWDVDVVDALLRVIATRTDDDVWTLDAVGTAPEQDGAPIRIGCDCEPAVAA
ncbi:MAG: HD-GYP domain-containing protein [Actinomycetota bacterium]